MNEEALKYSFELFQKDGYSGTFNDYVNLINSNPEALDYSHNLFSKDGFEGSLDDFSSLVGVKKKDEPVVSTSPEGGTDFTTQEQKDLGSLGSSPVGFEEQVKGIQAYFERRDLDGDDVNDDVNIQAAIKSGVISDQDLIDAGYKQPEQVDVLSQPNQQRVQYAKNKISALRVKTQEEIDFAIQQKRLDTPYAYQNSASEDTFVNDLYDSSLLASMNVSPKDFDGFLEERGFKKDFLDKQERGLFQRTYGTGGDPALAFEAEKMRMLNLYVSDQLERDVNWQKLQSQKETGVNPDFEGKQFIPSQNNVDLNKLTEYVENEMPLITKKLKERDVKNKEIYKKHVNGEMGVTDFASNLVSEGWKGFSDRVNDLAASTYGFVGDKVGLDYFSNIADATRLAVDTEKLLRTDNLSYAYASGKTIEYDGKKYLVDDNNQVYDLDSKIRVTQFLDDIAYNEIVSNAKDFGVDDQTFSATGTAYQTANVVGDLVVQIALTRGAGTTMAAAGGFTRGLGVLGRTKGLLKTIPMSREMASAIVAQATMGASSGYERTLREAKDAGLNDAEARELATYSSSQMALLYALTAPISPQTKATEAIFGKIRNASIKEAIEAYKKVGREGVIGVFEKYGKKALNYGGEGLKETFQENIQQGGEAFVVNRNINEEAGQEIARDTITMDEFVNTSILSFLAGGLMPAAGSTVDAGKRSIRKMLGLDGIDRMKSLDYLSRNEQKVVDLLNDQVGKGVYTMDAATDLLSEINTYKEGIGKIPSDLTPEIALEVMGDVEKIRSLEAKRDKLDPVFHSAVNQEIEQVRENIKQKVEQDAIQEQETRDIPDAQPAEGVQEVEEEVREPVVEEEVTPELYTLPETKKEWVNDFNIIDNRDGKAGLEINEDDGKTGRWYVENNKTGFIGAVKTKAEAQEVINDPDLMDYGEGQPIIVEPKIQEDAEARDIPDVEPAEGVQEVRESAVEEKEKIVSPIQENLLEGETIVDAKQDDKGRILTTTKQESEKDGVKVTKFNFNRSDKASNQRNSTFADEQAALDGTNLEIDPIDKAIFEEDLEEGTNVVYKIGEIREGKRGTSATVMVETTLPDGTIKKQKAEVALIPKVEQEIKTQEDAETTIKVKPGNRLFNEPLKEVNEVANGYYQRVFDSPRPKFEGTTELDKERAKRISDAFEAMEYNPNDPEVKAAYEALSKETLDQYQAFLDAGYTVEIDNVDAYGNSQEMIDDLRQNKRIKIFSTEAGFGKDPITDKQRQENPLLRDSGFKDVNGQTMLINDVFRAIHDFFGHAELGNGFGPKGEENAWNVHARMFSPLARRAMTTETRGQNSYVNFSGVNEKVEALRDQARALRDQGKETEAQKIVDEIYALTEFANQKIGLLPEEFSKTDEEISGQPEVEQGVDEIIKEAKDRGVSDIEIRKLLIEDGMSVDDAEFAVKKYNQREIAEKQKGEGIRIINNKVLKNLDRLLKFVTSSKGYMPKSMQVSKETKNGFIQGNTKRAKNTLRKLEKAVSNYKGDKEALSRDIDLMLRGAPQPNLPENIQAIVVEMRTHIDALSNALIESGAVSDVQFDELSKQRQNELIKQYGSEEEARANYSTAKENVLNNMGSYLTRSYEVYSSKNWKDKVAQETIDKAKNYLREQLRPMAEKQAAEENRSADSVLEENVNSIVNRLIDQDQAKAFIQNANDASKKVGILRQRKDIPAELRALMGEYTNPAMNYIISVNKVASLVAQQKFLNEMKAVGEGVFFFNDDTTPGFNTRIAAEGSETMNPLDGMYTTPEIAEALKGSSVININLGPIQSAVDLYLKSVGLVKYNKTILSPGTHAKNFLGNMYFMLANGYLDPKDFFTATKVVSNDLFGASNDKLNEKLIEYIEAGIINQSATLRDLKDMMSGKEAKVDNMDQFEKRMIGRFNKPTWTKLKEKPEKWYQAEDDFFKIVAYESNKQRYAQALHGKPFEELNEAQQTEVTDKVKEIVKNTLPNYDRLPEVRRLMRALPLTGTFISFHIEAIRTAYNTLAIATQEIKDPKTRAIGMKRLSGILSMIGLKVFALSSLGIGGDDDEMESVVRTFLPPWSKNSSIVIEQADNGVIKYRDLSASDPWGVVDRAIIGYMSGKTEIDGFINAIQEFAGPFVEPDILLNAISEMKEKTDASQTFDQNAEIVMKELYKVLSPGALTSGERILLDDKQSFLDIAMGQKARRKTEGLTNEFVGQISGYKNRTIDVDKAIYFKFRDVASAGIGKSTPGSARLAASLYNKKYYDYKNDRIEKAELDDAYNKSNQAYQKEIMKAIMYYENALKLGLSVPQIRKQMASAGFSSREIRAIRRGTPPNLKKK